MDKNMVWLNETKIKRTVEAINANNMNGYFAKSGEEAIEIIKGIIQPGDVVGCGGSMTLSELGILDFLREGEYEFLDRYKEGLTTEEIIKIYKDSFTADAYFTSSNAITEEGELYNVDGNGNRVAAMLYGPERVIVVAGVNKIVKDLDDAIRRNEEIAAPANTKRLDKKTPCATTGYCMDCKSEQRICNEYTVIKRQRDKGRMHVIVLNEELGY